MSAAFTPRAELRDGDRVQLTGADWPDDVDIKGEVFVLHLTGGEEWGAHIRDSDGFEWYVRDPTRYQNGRVIDFSVTKVEGK